MRTLLTLILPFFSLALQAQDNTGIMQPNASNLLMPRGVYDFGFRLPRVAGTPTGTPRLLNLSYWGSKGALVYDTTGSRVLVYNGTTWQPIATPFTTADARNAISLTTNGSSGPATYNAGTGVLNVPQYTLAGLGGVPTTRTLTINGTAFDLSADRSWTIATGGISTLANIGSTPNAQGASISGTTLTLQPANASFGGVVTTAAQTFAGNKTFSSPIRITPNNVGSLKILFYEGGDGYRAGIGFSRTAGRDDVQFFHPNWNNSNGFSWNSAPINTDMQAVGTNELMRLAPIGLFVNVPFIPNQALKITPNVASGTKLFFYEGLDGFRGGVGLAQIPDRTDIQFFYPRWNQNNGFSWNAAPINTDMQAVGTNELMRLNPAALTVNNSLILNTTTGGLINARLTQAQRDAIASPATALTIYCTNCTATDGSTGVMQTYNGSTWKNYW